MNQVFDINRFGLLMRKHWSDNRNKYLLSLGAIASLLFLWFGFLILVEGQHAADMGMQFVTYYVGLFLTGSFYASTLFSDLANKPKAINYLAVPASQLEKVLVSFVFCVIVFSVCYTVSFYVVDFLMVKLANAVGLARWEERDQPAYAFEAKQVINVFYIDGNRSNPFAGMAVMVLLFFAVQGAFALGSIYFPTYSFIKTTIAILLLILFFVFLVAKVLLPLLPQGAFADGLSQFNLNQPNEPWGSNYIELPWWTGGVLFGFFKYVVAPVFWVAAYFRLKEKEV